MLACASAVAGVHASGGGARRTQQQKTINQSPKLLSTRGEGRGPHPGRRETTLCAATATDGSSHEAAVPSPSNAAASPQRHPRATTAAAGRRDMLSSAAIAAAALIVSPLAAIRVEPAWAAYGADAGAAGDAAAAADVTFSTFYGAASPPATYGYLGGTTPDKAKYSYEKPSNWVEEAPTKAGLARLHKSPLFSSLT